MFVKKSGKYFLTLTESQVSIIKGLIQERMKSYANLIVDDFDEDFVELSDLEDYLFHYQMELDKN